MELSLVMNTFKESFSNYMNELAGKGINIITKEHIQEFMMRFKQENPDIVRK